MSLRLKEILSVKEIDKIILRRMRTKELSGKRQKMTIYVAIRVFDDRR